MRYSVAALAFAVSISASAAAEPLPRFGHNILYPDAREALIKLGWQPFGVAAVDRSCERREATCAAYPEAVSCAPVGLEVCSMLWRRAGQTIRVETIGDENMLVRSVSCSGEC